MLVHTLLYVFRIKKYFLSLSLNFDELAIFVHCTLKPFYI